jgi:hypothetical protein
MRNDAREDWSTLQGSPSLEAPRWIGDELSTQVRRDLEPGYLFLLSKILGVHLIAGTASLLVCPQFGVHPLGLSFDPLAFLLAYGEWVCGLGCGMVFSGLTALSLLFFLTRDERRVSSRLGFWLFTPVMSLSWALLMGLGGSQHGTHHSSHSISLVFSLFWLAGAVCFSWGVLALSDRKVSRVTH